MSENNSGRVTTRQFYEALVEQTKEMGKMELRIVNKINDGIAAQQELQKSVESRLTADYERIGALEGDVEKLEKWDKRIGILSVIGSVIASAIGIEK